MLDILLHVRTVSAIGIRRYICTIITSHESIDWKRTFNNCSGNTLCMLCNAHWTTQRISWAITEDKHIAGMCYFTGCIVKSHLWKQCYISLSMTWIHCCFRQSVHEQHWAAKMSDKSPAQGICSVLVMILHNGENVTYTSRISEKLLLFNSTQKLGDGTLVIFCNTNYHLT